ncbi:hypothetical protein BDW62DRAFT_202530 [Aspergillus aurantiobrunneus]
MSQEPPQPNQTTQSIPNREADFQRFKSYAALSFLIASPVLIALPPRKLDHLTVLLTGAFCVSANHITRERTGRSIVDRIESCIARSSNHTPSPSPLIGADLPTDRAREIQAKIRAAREARMNEEGVGKEEMEKLRARKEQDRRVVERLWMGSESAGWKERRLEEERKALGEGRGYGDLIKEHIWDVWTWGKKEGTGEGSERDKGQ